MEIQASVAVDSIKSGKGSAGHGFQSLTGWISIQSFILSALSLSIYAVLHCIRLLLLPPTVHSGIVMEGV